MPPSPNESKFTFSPDSICEIRTWLFLLWRVLFLFRLDVYSNSRRRRSASDWKTKIRINFRGVVAGLCSINFSAEFSSCFIDALRQNCLLLLLPSMSCRDHNFPFSPFHYLWGHIAAFIMVTTFLPVSVVSHDPRCFLLLLSPSIGLRGGFRCASNLGFKFWIVKIIGKNIVLVRLQFILSYCDFRYDGYTSRFSIWILRWLLFLWFPIIHHNRIFHSSLDESNCPISIYNYFIITYIRPLNFSTRSFGKINPQQIRQWLRSYRSDLLLLLLLLLLSLRAPNLIVCKAVIIFPFHRYFHRRSIAIMDWDYWNNYFNWLDSRR